MDELHGVADPAHPGLDQWAALLSPTQCIEAQGLEVTHGPGRRARAWVCFFVMRHQRTPVCGARGVQGAANIVGSQGHVAR